MEPSLFTLIIRGEIPASFVTKGEDWVAFLDINPRREGHTLVVPHKQVQRISDLNTESLSSLWNGVQQTQNILSQHFCTDDFSIVIHDGPLAGQEIPHVHIHVIPRTVNDGGKSILSMWPKTPLPSEKEPDFQALTNLSNALQGE